MIRLILPVAVANFAGLSYFVYLLKQGIKYFMYINVKNHNLIIIIFEKTSFYF